MMGNIAKNTRKFRAKRHFFATGQAVGAQSRLRGGGGWALSCGFKAGLVQTGRDGRRDVETGKWERQGARLNQRVKETTGKGGALGGNQESCRGDQQASQGRCEAGMNGLPWLAPLSWTVRTPPLLVSAQGCRPRSPLPQAQAMRSGICRARPLV